MINPAATALIRADLARLRWVLLCVVLLAAASLALSVWLSGDEHGFGVDIGLILLITTFIAYGILIVMLLLLREAIDRTRLFALSLPLTPGQYSAAKVIAALIAFVLPWLVIVIGVVVLTVSTGERQGGLPFFLVMMGLFLVHFCVLLAVVAVTLSELWTVVGILVTNTLVPVVMALTSTRTGAAERSRQMVADWSPDMLTLLAIEVVLIVLALSLALYLPSRCRDAV